MRSVIAFVGLARSRRIGSVNRHRLPVSVCIGQPCRAAACNVNARVSQAGNRLGDPGSPIFFCDRHRWG